MTTQQAGDRGASRAARCVLRCVRARKQGVGTQLPVQPESVGGLFTRSMRQPHRHQHTPHQQCSCDEDPGPREPLGGLTGGGYTGRTGMVFTPNKMKM
ncbi:hypothetical protein DdX_08833 [Ditylenchus destructor]|uniref:Uncharacterized protein n=1 Tax=Ditylenchus destructor TaxID=166010 RepID=A0AAD4N252_9BILA|nr:hypothetical protein DdX_08833 [Ditylenchus destructor]